jgi:hypothetical protein
MPWVPERGGHSAPLISASARWAGLAVTALLGCTSAPAPAPLPVEPPLDAAPTRSCDALSDCSFDEHDRAHPLDALPSPTTEERRVLEHWLASALGVEGETPSVLEARCGPVRLRSHVAEEADRKNNRVHGFCRHWPGIGAWG